MSIRYTKAELKALRTGLAAGKSIPQIAKELGRGRSAMYQRAIKEGWHKTKDREAQGAAAEEIRKRYATENTKALAEDLGLTLRRTYNIASRMGLKKAPAYNMTGHSGRFQKGSTAGKKTRFKKGCTPHNKGQRMPGYAPGRMAETQFKPGQQTHTWKPIGTLRKRRDKTGIVYVERKMTDTGYTAGDYVAVHRLVWIEAHGPIPNGHVVRFKDGMHTSDPAAIKPEMLECISKRENMARNTLHRYPKPIAGLMRMRGSLNQQIRKAEKQISQRNESK